MRSKTSKRIAFFAVAFIVAASVCVASVLSTPKAYARDSYNLRSDIETALSNFENKVKDGNIYTNLQDAYTKYVTLSKTYDQYILGNNADNLGVNGSVIRRYIEELNNATNALTTTWSPKTVTGNNMADGDHMWWGTANSEDDKNNGRDTDTWSTIKNEFTNLLWLEKNYNCNKFGRGDINIVDHPDTVFEVTYPISVLVYDGVKTPTFPVLVGARAQSGTSDRFLYGASVNNSNLSITRNWTSGQGTGKGTTRTRDFTWNYNGGTKLAISTTEHTGTSSRYCGNRYTNGGQGYTYGATYINYDQPADSNAYVERLRPSFTPCAGSKSNPQDNIRDGHSWYDDIDATGTGDTDIYVINYKALIDAVNGAGVKDCLSNITNYSEGGLASLFTALNTAMNYDYNGKITADAENVKDASGTWTEANLISTLSAQVDAVGNDIKKAVDGINNAVNSKTEDGFESLREAIKNTMDTYDKGNVSNICPTPWSEFEEAFKAAQKCIVDSGKSGDYSNSDEAQSLATALNEKFKNLEGKVHQLSAEQEKLRNAKNYQEAFDQDYGLIENVTPATCTDAGKFDFLWMCDNCGVEIVELTNKDIEIPKIDHSSQMTTIAAKTDAYCDEQNHDAYYQCNVTGLDSNYYEPCHKYFKEANGSGTPYDSEKDILAVIGTDGTQHKNLERTDANDPDCATKTNGNVAYVHCTDCGNYYAADDTGFEHPQKDANSFTVAWAHNFNNGKTEYKAPTCIADGNKEYYTCSACKQKFLSNNSQAADPATDDQITIKHNGTEHPLEKLPHSDGKAKTCTTPGEEPHYYCETCGKNFSDEAGTEPMDNIVIPASHGTYTFTAAKTPTCVSGGNIQYYQCNDCKKYFNDSSLTDEVKDQKVTLPKDTSPTGHKNADTGESTLVDRSKAVTCTEDGIKGWQCTQCNKRYTDKTATSELTGNTYIVPKCHVLKEVAGKDATCVENGLVKCWQCTREGDGSCGKLYYSTNTPTTSETGFAKQKEITATGHEFKLVPEQVPNCVDQGVEQYYTCNKCSKKFESNTDKMSTKYLDAPKTEAVNPKNHKSELVRTDKKDPVCATMTPGNVAYVYCPDCKNYYAATDTGYDDPKKDTSTFTLAASHTIDPVKDHHEFKDKTCTTPGNNEYYTCSVCKQNFKDAAGKQPADNAYITIPASHGNPIEHKEVKATCMKGGNKLYYECDVCNEYFNDASLTDKIEYKDSVNTSPDASRHWNNDLNRSTLVNREKAPTCTTDGVKGYQCTQCGKRYTNAAATSEIKDNSYIVPKCHVFGAKTEGKKATCVDPGTETCWQCTRETGGCGKLYYSKNDPTTTEKGFAAPKVIEATGHTFTPVEAKAATCVDKGREAYYECKKCSHSFKTNTDTKSTDYLTDPDTELEVAVNPKNHANAEEIPYKRPTCRAEGMEAHVYCDACGNYYDNMKDANANENAKRDETSYVIAKDHAIDPVEAKEPTCAEGGNYAYWKCHTCGTCFNDPDGGDDHIINENDMKRAIDPANHTDLKSVEKKDETCTEDGVKAHYYCSGCKTNFSDDKGLVKATDEQLRIAAHHVITKEHPAVTATCVVEGWKAYWECEKCGKFFENKDDTEPLADVNDMKLGLDENNHVNVVPVAAVAPDCKTEKNGVKAHYQCKDCNDLFTDKAGQKPTTLSALADPYKHTLSEIPKVAPTCTAVGYEKHYKCSVCEKLFTDDQGKKATTLKALEIAATGHTRGEVKTVIDKEATCTAKGKQHDEVYCSVCKNLIARENEKDIPMIAHTRGEVKTVIDKEATCTEKGKQHDEVYCSVCKNKFIESENEKDIPMIAHTRGEVKTVIDKEATCTAKGRQHDEVYCSVCKNKFIDSENAKDIPMIPHKGPRKTITDVVATCYAEGKEHDANVCDMCGTEYDKSAERTVAKLAHPDGTKVTRTKKEATCQETGIEYDALVCIICGEEYNVSPDREIPKIYHRTGSIKRVVLKEATCTQTGEYYDEYTCNMCGKVYGKSATITQQMIPHTQGKVEKSVIKESTCTEKGLQENKLFCKVCGQNYSSFTSEIDLKPHTAGDPIISEYVAPTEDRVGSYLKTVKCTVCGEILSQKRVPIQPTGSAPDDDVDLEIIYDVTDSTYLEYSGTGADIHCTGPLDMFIAVMLDGKLVDESKYDLFDGSTLVSFHSDYLDGLKLGKHEVVLLYTYDTITTNLTIYGTNGDTEPDNPPVVDPNAGNSGSSGNTGSTVTKPVTDDKPGTAEDKPAANGGSATSPETGVKVAIPAFISVAFAGAYILFGSKKRKNDGD